MVRGKTSNGNERVYKGIYEIGIYPRKSRNGETLFAYLVPQNITGKKKIVKIAKLKDVEIYEKNKLKDRINGEIPSALMSRTVRMSNGECRYNPDSDTLICNTDRIIYFKHRGGK